MFLRNARRLFLLFVVLGLAGLVGTTIYSYSQLSASSPRVNAISPKITNDVSALFSAGAKLASGNLLGAAEDLVDDVSIQIELEITNDGLVPVYMGIADYTLVFNDIEVAEAVAGSAGWLGPGSTSVVVLDMTVAITDLPGPVVLGLVQGGLVDIQVKAKVGWGPFSKDLATPLVQFRITDTIESMVERLLPN